MTKNRKDAEKSIFTQIDELYFNFTKTEKRLADYLIKNRVAPQYMSISELAQASEVAEATISRFCRKLGLEGFNNFKLELAKAAVASRISQTEPGLEARPGQGDITSVAQGLAQLQIEAIKQTLEFMVPEDYQRAAELIHRARRVYCMGLGGSRVLAFEAYSLFSTVTPKFTSLSDPHMHNYITANLDENDLILYFSYSGSTKDLLDLLEIANQRKVQTILISRYPNSPGAKLAGLTLQCGSNENVLRSGSVAARVAQLMVIDLLFELFINLDFENYDLARERALKSLGKKML